MSRLIEGYRETRDLGGGATGRVALAVHEATGTQVAIKHLAEQLRSDAAGLGAFRAEARLLCALDSPHVVRLWEYVEDVAGAAIVMELVNGVSLRALLREQGPTTPEAALSVLKGSLAGLAAAHEAGVVHRDYKPENVLVDTDGASKLADFGISVRSGRTVDVAGTPSYMAPEQWRGAPAGPGTDIYAATATFVECLTGHPPFAADDVALLRRQHENAPVPVDDVPDPLRDLVRSGLAKDPRQRPSDARSLLSELEAVAGSVYGPDWEERGRQHLARRVALLLPLGGAAGGGSAVATTVLGRGRWLFAAGLVALGLAGGAGAVNLASSDTTLGGPTAAATSPASVPSPSIVGPPPTTAPGAPPTTAAAAPTTAAQPPPAPPPPPTTGPTVQVQKLSIVSFAYDGVSTTVVVSVHIQTTSSGAVTLKLRYAGSNVDNAPGNFSAVTHSVPLSGATSYDVVDSFDANVYACNVLWVGVGVTTTPAAQGGGPTYADLNAPPC